MPGGASSVPNRERTPTKLLEQLVDSMDLLVEGPHIVTAAGLALMDNKFCVVRMLQNVGTNAVLVAIGVANPAIDGYHFVLAAGTAANDGLGGSVDLSRVRGNVYVAGADGNPPRVATFQARRDV